jgi:hypothetical protein
VTEDLLASALRNRLDEVSSRRRSWSFRQDAVRRHAHAYFRYPAMMVPQMQATIMAALRDIDPAITLVFDPFVGSGTVVTESMLAGMSVRGTDVNPLAVLLCRAKAGPFFVDALGDEFRALSDRLHADTGTRLEIDFPGRRKWFSKSSLIRLSRIVRAIRKAKPLWARRFFWVALAETVRLSSNSRTSTFKLHIRPATELTCVRADPIELFLARVERNAGLSAENARLLSELCLLKGGHYAGTVDIRLGDACQSPDTTPSRLADLLITSPPYGDNVTTVPYGQHSYLPLQCIDLTDIDSHATEEYLRSTHEIDRRSLGGSRFQAADFVPSLSRKSSSLARLFARLATVPRDRLLRAAAFWNDLDRGLDSILSGVRSDAFLVWTVGERKTGGARVPFFDIMRELMEYRGCTYATSLRRTIPSKRMAIRNDITTTMRHERVLIMKNRTR